LIGSGTNYAVFGTYRAGRTKSSVYERDGSVERRRARTPARTRHDVVPILQRLDIVADQLVDGITDKRIGWREGAGNPDRAVAPGDRAGIGCCDIGAVEMVLDRVFADNFDGSPTP
jgi:hypothetical protein